MSVDKAMWVLVVDDYNTMRQVPGTIYKCDYYLSLTNVDNHDTHVHLIIRNFYKNSRSQHGATFAVS